MVDPALITGGIEIAKLAAQIMFAAARQAGMTEEQLDTFIFDQREAFKQRPASALPDV